MHRPVLVEQTIEALNITPGGKYIDATAGEGGHIERILAKGGEVLALDWDSHQIEKLKQKIQDSHLRTQVGNYAEVDILAQQADFVPVDGILFDLGLSYMQMKESGKGFSYKNLEEPLDMRIGGTEITAADILNSYSEEELYYILAAYSEDLNSKKIAQQIVQYRKHYKIEIVEDLLNILDAAVNKGTLKHTHDSYQLYARIFQALRIAVNHEFENIKKGLLGATKILKPEGRIVVITFHSLEDRIVKQFARTHNLKLLKNIVAEPEYAFERSAKLRIITNI